MQVTRHSTHSNKRLTTKKRFHPSKADLDTFAKGTHLTDQLVTGDRVVRNMMIGGLTGAGVGGVLATIANPALGLTVPGSALICGCLGAGLGGLIAKTAGH